METLLAITAVMFFAMLSLVAPVLAIIAIVKARRLEGELRSIKQRLAATEQPSRPPVAPAPVVTPASAPTPTPAKPATPTPPKLITPTPPPPPKPRTPKREIQWERWLGIRGAAVVGGVLFALAGLLFFKHALDQGWVTPIKRVLSGVLVGLGAIVVGEFFRRRKYSVAPAATAGGGIVVLYATIWASYQLYDFTSALTALPLMAGVTALCAWLAIRFQSQLVAVLGLVGGFATPLLLSIQAEHPIGLFGYLLLLDIGLLALGQKMKWSTLGVLGMLGTFAVESVWAIGHLDVEYLPLALISLGAFALVFVAASMLSPTSERRQWVITQAGALLLPFAFAIYFAVHADFGRALWPLAVLVGFLAVGAGWVGTRQNAPWLSNGTAAGALAITGTWLLRTGNAAGALWEYSLVSLGLVALFMLIEHYFASSTEPRVTSRWSLPATPAIVGLGFAVMTILAALMISHTSPWPWLCVALGHAAFLHIQGKHYDAGPLRLVGAICAGIVLAFYLRYIAHTGDAGVPGAALTIAWMLVASLGFLGLAFTSSRRDETHEERWSWHAAAVFPLILLACLPSGGALLGISHSMDLSVTILLAGLALVSPMLRGWGIWYGATLLIFLAQRIDWIETFTFNKQVHPLAGKIFLFEILALAVLAAAPFLSRLRLATSHIAWASAALLLAVMSPTMSSLAALHFDDPEPWQAFATLGIVALALGAATRYVLATAAPSRNAATSWLIGVGTMLSSFALAYALDHDEILIAVALTGLGLAVLWHFLPSTPLKIASCAFITASAVGVALLVLVSVFGNAHFLTGPFFIINWTSYTTGIPTLCALCAAYLYWQREGRTWSVGLSGLIAALLAFIWINMQVYVYFEPGDALHLDRDYGPARDLTLSICWILYALLLLGGGMLRKIPVMRQISLAFLLLTLVKVFLHDLGDLRGLYRVGSLFGLAISLLLVSLLYQRFVFRK